MERSLKNRTAVAFSAVAIFVTFFSSCNKSNNTQSTTRVFCVTCANGGACINGTCQCVAGYEGVSCETISREKFLGTWTVSEKGTVTSARFYSVSINSNFNSSAVGAVTINGFYDFFTATNVTGYVVADSLYIPSQSISGKTFIGAGNIYANIPAGYTYGTISMHYAVTDSATGKVDDFGYYSSTDSASVWNK